MGRYVLRRLIQLVPVFFGTTFIIFAGVFALPGDQVRGLFGIRTPDPAVLDEIRRAYNLDKPLVEQYWLYISDVFRGNLGQDFGGRPVSDILAAAWPVTVKLGLTAFAIEVCVGVLAGVLSALRRGGFLDNFVLLSTTLIISMPVFLLGIAAQLTFAVKLGLFRISSVARGWPTAYLLPALVLSSLQLAALTRVTRSSVVENLRADYVRTAIAKGLPRRSVIGKHAMRNSLIPVVTVLGIDVGALIGGAVVTESVFNLNGVGRTLFEAIDDQENTVVVGISTVLVMIVIFTNLAVDLLYGVLDPRIRYD